MSIFELVAQYDILSYNLGDDVVGLDMFGFIKTIWGKFTDALPRRSEKAPRGSKLDVKPPKPIESKRQGQRDESRVQTEVQRTPEPERKVLTSEDPDYDHLVSEDHIFNAGDKTAIHEHSNPVIRRILDTIASGESLEILYVIDLDRLLLPNDHREYKFREIKPLEVFSSSAWTKSLYIGAESNGELKTFRADRMALLNSDGTISIGGDVPCSSKDCSNEVRVELDKYNQSKVDKFCVSCQPNPEPTPQIGPDDDNSNGDASQEESESDNEQIVPIIKSKFNSTSNPPMEKGGVRDLPRKPSQLSDYSTRRRYRRPKLICRRPHGSLRYEIELNTRDCDITEVFQNGTPLTGVADEYRLSSYLGYLEVTYKDESNYRITLFDGSNPLIFKLSEGWQDPGHRQKRITNGGYFLVFMPRDWPRNGKPPNTPAPCGDKEFLAHSLVRKNDQDNSLDLPILLLGNTASPFGEFVYDDSDQGPLFIGEVPKLKVPPNINWVRAGEEYPGSWKGENFKPNDKTLEEVLDGRQGHFFIRVFDVVRLDSAEFRYMRDLRKILVDGKPYTKDTILLPHSTEGYLQTKLQFVDEDENNIHPSTDVQPDGTVLVEPYPGADRIVCSFSLNKGQVDIRVDLPRIWWCFESDNAWHCTPLRMTRQKFGEYARDGMIIKLRLPPRIKSVYVGFNHKLGPAGPLDRSQGQTQIELKLPMRDFRNYKQIREHLDTDAWLNIQCHGNEFITPPISLVQIRSDPALSPEPKPPSERKRIKQIRTDQSDPGLDSSKRRRNSRKPDEKPPYVLQRGHRSFKRHEVQKMSLADIHHLNLSLLRKCVNDRGKIYSAHRNGLPAKYQRAVRAAVIRARYLALLPYVPDHRRLTATLSHGNKGETLDYEKGKI